MLGELVRDVPPTHDEFFEARGLLGRSSKQRYVNAQDPVAAQTSLLTAIEAYRSVFDEDNTNTWHGVNAASLILRAARDGIGGPPRDETRRIAEATLAALDQRQEKMVRENLTNPEAMEREGAELLSDHRRAVER